jgi:chromosome partitioning protein
MATIIGIINQKGGVGKTTTAVNLAAFIAKRGWKVLLVDTDSQGNATSGLSMDRKRFHPHIYDAMMGDVPVKECIYPTEMKHLFLLPSSIDLAGAEIEMVSMEHREFILKNLFDPLRDEFDFIIIDCPPALGLMTLNVLTASDSIIIPIQAEFYALEGLSQLIRTIRAVTHKLNPNLHILGILLTMFDGRTNLSLQVQDDVKKYFGDTVFKTVIPRSVKLSEAPGFGKPIALYAPKSKGGTAYKKLSREVIKRVKK